MKKKIGVSSATHNSIKRLFEEGHKKHIWAPLNWWFEFFLQLFVKCGGI